MDFEQTKYNIAARLGQFQRKLKTAEIVELKTLKLNSRDFRTREQILQIGKSIGKIGLPAIYIISAATKNKANELVEIFEPFHAINKEKKDEKKNSGNLLDGKIHTSRFNGVIDKSKTLYVGSCVNEVKERLMQHLGKCYQRTSSLHLNKWDSDLDYTITIMILTIKSNIDLLLKKHLIELIEQDFWDQLKPIFGKRSGN